MLVKSFVKINISNLKNNQLNQISLNNIGDDYMATGLVRSGNYSIIISMRNKTNTYYSNIL